MNKLLFSSGYNKNNKKLNKLGYNSIYYDYYKKTNTIWCFGDSILFNSLTPFYSYFEKLVDYTFLNFGVQGASIYTVKRIMDEAFLELEKPKFIFFITTRPYRKEYLLDDGFYYQASLGVEKIYPVLPYEGSGFPNPILYDLSKETSVNLEILNTKNIPIFYYNPSYEDLLSFYVNKDNYLNKKLAKYFYNML